MIGRCAVIRYINIILPIYLPPSVTSALILLITNLILLFVPRKMVCRNICDRLECKPSFEYDQYIVGKKYCRRCEVYFYHSGLFCPCCGMQLRRTPASKNGKERLRRKKKVLIKLQTVKKSV